MREKTITNEFCRHVENSSVSAMMKRVFLCAVLFFLCCSVFAQANNSVVVWVMPTEGINLDNSESRWLPDGIQKYLREKITNYTVLIVADENPDSLARIQEISYNENISENDAVRMGEMFGARYQIKSSVTKTGADYSLYVGFQDLETGQHLAEYNKSASSFENLYQRPGCALNEAVIEMCDKLNAKFGTGLSEYKKRLLMKGANDFSSEEEKKYLEEEEKRLSAIIDGLDKEIASSKISTAADAAIRTVQLELRRSQEQEKLKQAQQKQVRLEQEAQNRLEELEKQETRSDERKKRINIAETKIKDKIELLRKQNFETSSVLAQINEIEAKKKAIIEIEKETDDQVIKLQQERDQELSEKKKEIMDEPLRVVQKDSRTGEMLPSVRQDRENRYKEEEAKIRNEYDDRINSFTNIAYSAEYELMEQIENQYIDFGATRIADNIETRDLRLNVGRFRGEAAAWSATAMVLSDGEELCSYNFDIEYKTLTGKKPDPNDYEYADYVDFYSSLFSNEEAPPVWVKLYYDVMPDGSGEPSVYFINLRSLQIYLTATGDMLGFKSINKLESIQMSPCYDIRGVVARFEEKENIQTDEVASENQLDDLFKKLPSSQPQANNSNQQTNNSTSQSNNSSNWTATQKKTSIYDNIANVPQYPRSKYWYDGGYGIGPFYQGFYIGFNYLYPFGNYLYSGIGTAFSGVSVSKKYVDQAKNYRDEHFFSYEGYFILGLGYTLSFGRPYIQGNIGFYTYASDYIKGSGFMFSGLIGVDFGSIITISPYYGVKYSDGKGFDDVLGISLGWGF